MPKLTLDHPKRMLHFGADIGINLLNPIGHGKADFFHLNLTHETLNWVTFVDLS